jgi:glycogen phosphorylase
MYQNIDDFKQRYEELCHEHFAEAPTGLKPVEQYLALATLLSESIRSKWAVSRNVHTQEKKVYYFSSEFLIGHLLSQNIKALDAWDVVDDGLKSFGISFDQLLKIEHDAGLGNGGLGRLAACFMDSMTHLGIAGRGNSIRYKHGFFRQEIVDFEQKEVAENWMENGYPWETKRLGRSVDVHFGGNVNVGFKDGRLTFSHENYWQVKAVPYDVSIISNDNDEHVNALRLWDAQAKDGFNFHIYNAGDYTGAIANQIRAENLTQILYPNDSHPKGKQLRLMQEYFFVCAGVDAIVEEYVENMGCLDGIEDNICIHINDTHPALCVAELMRVFLDDHALLWKVAWEKTQKIISYTNHTILPEALETWSVELLNKVQPRVYMIIEEINRRFIDALMDDPKIDNAIIGQVSIIKDGYVHMAALSVVGSHSVNGVAELHSEIIKKSVMNPYYRLYPERFNNKTNGISPRIFLSNANPELSNLISEYIGDGWKHDSYQLKKLLDYKNDSKLIDQFKKIKYDNKVKLASIIKEKTGYEVDPNSIFDIQVKRIHAYKRQLLNILGIMYRCSSDPEYLNNMHPHTFIFAGKAAPSYDYAKSIIRLCCRLSQRINNDPILSKKIKVIFLPNFNVSLAQYIYPAADISQQISTAGMEASGTGNMKFMMNGAVTLGTLDGANVEIGELVGDDNIVIFGMDVDEVGASRSKNYDPMQYIVDPKMREMVNRLQSGFFVGDMRQFQDVYDSLFSHGDYFRVLEDFESYMAACKRCEDIYVDGDEFVKMQIHNIAMSGHFSSDRTIRQYAKEIWNVETK